MVLHIRLEKGQSYRNQVCLSCLAGMYGCRWKRYRRSKDPSTWVEILFAVLVVLVFICMLGWLYYWIIVGNDRDDVNTFIWEQLHTWFDWFTLFCALTIVMVIYTGSLLVLVCSHIITGLQLHLHWTHKIMMFLTLAGCITALVLLSKEYSPGFALVSLSLKITGPILQILCVFLLTALSWAVAATFYKNENTALRYTMVSVFLLCTVFIYFLPLLMSTPCLLEMDDLPSKPLLMAHRGAPQIAPENTIFSFQTAVEQDVFGFESDVKISADGMPFLLHDDVFDRTTNLAEVFPNRTFELAANFKWADIKRLDAGSWFLQRDPFKTVHKMSKETKDKIKKQKVTSLRELLELAVSKNKSVVFDLSRPPKNHPYFENWINYTVQYILESDIKEHQVWWLTDSQRTLVEEVAPEFLQTAEGFKTPEELKRLHITNVNAEYSEVSQKDISLYSLNNITSNLYTVNKFWLLSLYWCEGAYSVTTSACQSLTHLKSPHKVMTPAGYLALWIITDIISICFILVFFLIHRIHFYEYENNPEAISLNSSRHIYGSRTQRKSDRELLFKAKPSGSKDSPSSEDSPTRTPEAMMNDPVGVSQRASLPAHEEINMQMEE